MRVAYFTESLYPQVDGVSRTLARLFVSLEQAEVDFRVFAPFQPWSEVRWAARVRRVAYVPFPLYPDYRISLPPSARVRRELRSWRPDLIHLVSPTPMAFWAQRVARASQIPVVSSFHTHFVSYFPHYGIGRLESVGWSLLRRFYRGCERVYAPTPSIRGELEAHGIERVCLWSRGVDAERFSPRHRSDELRASVGADDRVPLILMVSRLVREKDLADLVEVDRILRSGEGDFRLVLVGDGPMRSELEAGLPAATFIGHQSGEALARWYASADMFVLPSTTETLGNVILEALVSAVPAVVVDRGGPRDLIVHGVNGFVARAKDAASIAGYLRELIDDPALRHRMAAAAQASVALRTWKGVNDQLLSSYREVIEAYRPVAGKNGGATR